MQDLILIRHNSRWGLSTKKVREMAHIAVREQFFGEKATVSILFCGSRVALKYNIDYRGMDYVPQVLGFPTEETKVEVDGYVYLGDILICTPLLKEEAILQNRKIEAILMDWLRHGVSNLLKPSLGTVKGLI